MYFRKLGKTNINVGVIGLGTEFLWHEPQNVVTTVVHEALDNCLKCGSCMKRCPFDVDIMANMEKAIKIFGN